MNPLTECKRFTMGQLSFYVTTIKCSECDFDFSSDEQMIYELYLNSSHYTSANSRSPWLSNPRFNMSHNSTNTTTGTNR